MILRTIVVTSFATNCYLLGCEETGQGIVIDPGGNASAILAAIKESKLKIAYIVNTHGHIDHIGANEALRQATGALLAAPALDNAMLADPSLNLGLFTGQAHLASKADLLLADGDHLLVGTLQLDILHTPGHTPGSVSLYLAKEGVVFTGDALFREGIGRTDFPGGNHEQLIRSIFTKLLTLPPETIVYPGHGPPTSIQHEKTYNPWLRVGSL